ncbi:5'-nucleotidase C-terminal domain-containing protein [Chryseobacterium sp. A301]
MKNKIWLFYLLPFFLSSCTSSLALEEIKTQPNLEISSSLPSDSAMVRFISPYKSALEQEMNAKIGHTEVELTKTGENSSLGNVFADYTFEGAKQWGKSHGIAVNAAVINIGGLRTSIGKGDVLLKHVFEVMPFENELVVVKMDANAMKELFEYYASTQTNNPVSHLYIETSNSKLVKSLVDGKPLDPSQTYYIATSDYLAFGGDNMNFFKKGETLLTGIKLRDLYIDLIKQNPEIKVPTDLRLQFNPKKSTD